MSLRRKKPKTAEDVVKPKARSENADVKSVTLESGAEVNIIVPPSYEVPKIFEWDAQKIRVAEMIAEGVPIYRIVGIPGMPTSRTTIYTWMKHPDFKKYINTLIMETGLANQTERMAAMQKVLNQMYDKLVGEFSSINLTEKNAASLIEKFFAGLRQIQEDARGYVQQIHVTSEQNVNANVQGLHINLDVEKALAQCPAEQRAILQQEFAARADAFIRGMNGVTPE
jgi:hypothetical protein